MTVFFEKRGDKIVPTNLDRTTEAMRTATERAEAAEKPSYGPHKATEQYLDAEDEIELTKCLEALGIVNSTTVGDPSILQVLSALETLRTHLRKKYYAG